MLEVSARGSLDEYLGARQVQHVGQRAQQVEPERVHRLGHVYDTVPACLVVTILRNRTSGSESHRVRIDPTGVDQLPLSRTSGAERPI